MRPPRATWRECSGVFRSGAGAARGALAASGAIAWVSVASAVSGAWLMLGSANWTRPGNLPARAPSVAEPERFRCGPVRPSAYSVGEARRGVPAFQSLIPLRSFCLSVSGAVAPSAPDFSGLSRRDRLSAAAGINATPDGAGIVEPQDHKSTGRD